MNPTCLEWSTASAAMPGESESGDLHLACATPNGMLVAVLDGLGHGSEAAAAARAAVGTLERYAYEPVIALLGRCHETLKSTRGVTMSLATFNARYGTMTWIGVGNVEGFLLRADPQLPNEQLLLRSGVVGSHLPLLQAAVIPVSPGDTLLFATDGIASDFAEVATINGPLQAIVDRVLAKANKGTDDALVMIARFRGPEL
jgi:phosphoserine phosphatase RsbX